MVSKQFGENIKLVSKPFVPVIISANNIDDVFDTLKLFINNFKDKLSNTPENYKLVDIRNKYFK